MLTAQVEELKSKLYLFESYQLEDSDDDDDDDDDDTDNGGRNMDAVLPLGTDTASSDETGPVEGGCGSRDKGVEVNM